MAILNSLICNGPSRFLNKIYCGDIDVSGTAGFSNLAVSGTSTLTGAVTAGSTVTATGDITTSGAIKTGISGLHINGKQAIYTGSTTDNWLRINQQKPFSSGVYFGQSPIRTDANLQVGENGQYFLANSSGVTTIKLKAVDIEATNSITSPKWEIDSIANLGGTFMVAPTIYFSNEATVATGTITSTTMPITITDNSSNSPFNGVTAENKLAGTTWFQGAKVKFSGTINGVGFSSAEGVVSAQMTTSNKKIQLTITTSKAYNVLTSNTSYTGSQIDNIVVMQYQTPTSNNGSTLNPLGIYMSSFGDQRKSFIDIYGGTSSGDPDVRIGLLTGMAAIGGQTPTGWGIAVKSGSGYFGGTLCAPSGTIGGWTIGTYTLTNGNLGQNNSMCLRTSDLDNADAVSIGGSPSNIITWRIGAGSKFGVTRDGDCYCSNIQATGGKIGGWTIGSSALSTGNYGDTNSIYLSNTTMASKSIANVTSDKWVFTIDSHFGVTNAGKLCCDTVELTGSIAATSGSVGGWGIANNAIYSTTTDSTGLETTVALQNSTLNITTTNCIVSADGNSITATALENGSISFSSAVLPVSSGAGTYTVELTIIRPKDVQGDFSYSFNTASGSGTAGVVVIPAVIGSGSGMVTTTDSFSSNSSITPTSITVGASLTNCRKDDQMIVQFVIKKGSTVVPIGWDYGDNTKLPSNIIIGVTKKDSSDNLSTPFYITNSGKMYCENVEAVGGTIGGWTIGANALSTGTYGSDNSVYLSNATMASKSIGGKTSADWVFTIGSHFGVTNTGAIYSNSGTIGGWKIDSTGLSLDNSLLDTKLTPGELKISDTNTDGWFAVSITGTGIQLLEGASKEDVWPFVRIEHDRLQVHAATYKSCGIYADPVYGNYYGLYDFGRSRWMLFANESESDAVLYTQSSITASKSTGDIAFSVSNSTRRGRLLVNSSGVLGLYDATNSSWVIKSNDNQSVDIPHSLSVGGTLGTTGNITETKSSGDISIGGNNGTRNGKFLINSSGTLGLYDNTNSSWVIYSTTDQSVNIPHTFSTQILTGYGWDGTTARRFVQSSNQDGNYIGYISSNASTLGFRGQWGTAGAAFSNRTISCPSSDIRLKENIINSNINALSILDQIKIRAFDWKNEQLGHQNIGFIADEMEQIDSRFAIGGGYDEDGAMNVKSVDTFYLQGYEVKAIQELHQLIKEQAVEIQELKAKIKELKGM